MTTVHIGIINPSKIYSDLNIPMQFHLESHDFIELLKKELNSILIKHGVKSVFVSIQKNITDCDDYEITITNAKNDWQIENIREECDIAYISFIKKDHLISINKD